MFRIRREQKEAFRTHAVRVFVEKVMRHVERCFPDAWLALEEQGVRDAILLGIDRASVYGIRAECEVCKYIDLMLVFGLDFDQRCPWAAEILRAPAPLDPFARMRLLHERALEEA